MINLRSVEIDDFLDSFYKNKSQMLPQYSWKFLEEPYEKYLKSNLYITDNCSTFAIDKNGYILSFTYNIQDSSAEDVINEAIKLGGDKIKVYESFKNSFKNFGFTEVLSIIPWDDNNVPKDWHPSFGKEDLFLLSLPSRKIEEREITDTLSTMSLRDRVKFLSKDSNKNNKNNDKSIDTKKVDDDLTL